MSFYKKLGIKTAFSSPTRRKMFEKFELIDENNSVDNGCRSPTPSKKGGLVLSDVTVILEESSNKQKHNEDGRKRSDILSRMSDGIRGSLSNNNMKKTKPIASATAFIRKRKEKWRPSLTGSEDIHEGSTRSESNEYGHASSPTTPRTPMSPGPDDSNISLYDDGSEGSSITDGPVTSNLGRKSGSVKYKKT